MSGITAVYIVFGVVLASLFVYIYLLSRRQRELEGDIEALRQRVERKP